MVTMVFPSAARKEIEAGAPVGRKVPLAVVGVEAEIAELLIASAATIAAEMRRVRKPNAKNMRPSPCSLRSGHTILRQASELVSGLFGDLVDVLRVRRRALGLIARRGGTASTFVRETLALFLIALVLELLAFIHDRGMRTARAISHL